MDKKMVIVEKKKRIIITKVPNGWIVSEPADNVGSCAAVLCVFTSTERLTEYLKNVTWVDSTVVY